MAFPPPSLVIRNPVHQYLLSSFVLLSISSSGGPMGAVAAARKVGGRSEVSDVDSNEQVQDLGHFAVREYNRRVQDDRRRGQLAFSKVVAAQTQVASGVIYYLRVEAVVAEDVVDNAPAEDRRGPRPFDAVVVVRPWLGTRALISFAPSADVGDRPRRGVKLTADASTPTRWWSN